MRSVILPPQPSCEVRHLLCRALGFVKGLIGFRCLWYDLGDRRLRTGNDRRAMQQSEAVGFMLEQFRIPVASPEESHGRLPEPRGIL